MVNDAYLWIIQYSQHYFLWNFIFYPRNAFLAHQYKAKQKYRQMFQTQKSGNKTSSGEIGLDIRTHVSPKVGQDQVPGGVSLLCWHALKDALPPMVISNYHRWKPNTTKTDLVYWVIFVYFSQKYCLKHRSSCFNTISIYSIKLILCSHYRSMYKRLCQNEKHEFDQYTKGGHFSVAHMALKRLKIRPSWFALITFLKMVFRNFRNISSGRALA